MTAPLIPVRMINEYVYCPRLFHLEWVQQEFRDNHFTVEGDYVHRRVNRDEPGALPSDAERPFQTRSLQLSSESLGISGTIDLVEGEGGVLTPVDYKRGKPAPNAERAWEPERVQLCAYGLLLREAGHRTDGGVLYFAATKTRVEVPFDDALVALTREAIAHARALGESGVAPPPLVRSPKCGSCSLNAICLPDETHLLTSAEPNAEPVARRLIPRRDDQQPFYVQGHGLRVGLDHEVLEARDRDGKVVASARLGELSHLVLMGNVQLSTQALHEIFARGSSVCWTTWGGWFAGVTDGLGSKNVAIRKNQYRWAEQPERALALAKRFVRCKIANSRTLMRRNAEDADATLRALSEAYDSVESATKEGELLGIEGNAARAYFGNFRSMLRPLEAGAWAFNFEGRNRRPPTDAVNALLSFAYSMLTKELTLAARTVGLDPYLGFFHHARHGKPALALDLMEEFRPLIADSAVITAINTGALAAEDFVRHPLGVAMNADGRKKFLRVFERRLSDEVTHPIFGYRVSYRRILEVQCRLLARHLCGELAEYPEFRTR